MAEGGQTELEDMTEEQLLLTFARIRQLRRIDQMLQQQLEEQRKQDRIKNKILVIHDFITVCYDDLLDDLKWRCQEVAGCLLLLLLLLFTYLLLGAGYGRRLPQGVSAAEESGRSGGRTRIGEDLLRRRRSRFERDPERSPEQREPGTGPPSGPRPRRPSDGRDRC